MLDKIRACLGQTGRNLWRKNDGPFDGETKMSEFSPACMTSLHSRTMRPGKLERVSCLRAFVEVGCVWRCAREGAKFYVAFFYLFPLFSVNMAPTNHLSKEQISQVLVLKDAGHGTKEISDLMNINPSTVRRWIRRRRQENSGADPVPRKHTGRPRKTSLRATNVVKCAVESNPHITALWEVFLGLPVCSLGTGSATLFSWR